MAENRGSSRQRVLRSGKIVFANGRSVLDCSVRNLSDSGARLELPSIIGVPDHFDFYDRSGGEPRPATVVWRKKNTLGIKFD